MITNILVVAVLLLVAIILILLEIFLLPGMIAGFVGGIMGIGGLYYAYMIGPAVGNISLLASLVVFFAAFLWLMRTKSFSRVALKADINSKVASNLELGIKVGDKGTSLSRLAPMGKAEIGGHIVEVKSLNSFIDENTPIEVVRIENGILFVQ